jgi:2-iminobutanoate/2-iminopropanoate deaminase
MTLVDSPLPKARVQAVPVELPSLGLYSHAVRAPSPHRLLTISGQLAVDETGDSVGVGDFDTQMAQVLSNLETVLQADGMTPRNLLKMTTYLVDADNIADFYRVRETVWEKWFPERAFPGNTLLVVTRLVRPEFLLEIEGFAAATLPVGADTSEAGQ